MNFWRNPPAHLREREAARFPAWLKTLALSLPKLELLHATAEAVGPQTWRVRMAVGNAGYLPSYVTKRALEHKVARGTVFELTLPQGASLVQGKQRVVGAQLEGHAPKASLQAFLPNRDITGDRAVAEWLVHAAPGTTLTLKATADRAGSVTSQLHLRHA